MDDVRLDKYLWAVRIFKTRSDAAEAIRTNRVTVGGATCKPSREVRIGDVIAVKRMPVVYQYKVLDLVTSRQPAKNVPAYCLNITPQEFFNTDATAPQKSKELLREIERLTPEQTDHIMLVVRDLIKAQ